MVADREDARSRLPRICGRIHANEDGKNVMMDSSSGRESLQGKSGGERGEGKKQTMKLMMSVDVVDNR
jgi:hypothetical protein